MKLEAQALEVFRSSRHELMYVYLRANPDTQGANPDTIEQQSSADLSVLPEALLERFGTPVFSFAFVLDQDRELATADARTVLQAVQEQGFYLQMPPTLHPGETPDARNPHEHG